MDDKEKVEKALALVQAWNYQPLENVIRELEEMLLSGRVLGRTIYDDSEKCELARTMVSNCEPTVAGDGETDEEGTAIAQWEEIRDIFS